MAEIIEEQHIKVESEQEKKSGLGLWVAIIVLIILCIGVAGYFLLQQLRDEQKDLGGELNKDTQQMQELTRQISGYQEQLVAIQNQLSNLSKEVGSKESNYETKLSQVSTMHSERLDMTTDQLKESIQRIQRQLGKTRGDWLVADAEYLLSVANRRLHLVGDAPTAIEALIAADARLRESGDTAAFKVRGQITKEIALVKAIEEIDIVGIYSTLDMLEEDVDKLNVFLPYSGKGAEQVSGEGEGEGEEHKTLDTALFEIEGFISVRRLDRSVSTIITPEQKLFIVEQLSTKLAVTKLALVQHDDGLYQFALEDTLEWLTDNFTKDKVRGTFIAELNELKAIKIRNHFPDISQSLKMLRSIAKFRLEIDKALQSNKKATKTSKGESAVAAPVPQTSHQRGQ